MRVGIGVAVGVGLEVGMWAGTDDAAMGVGADVGAGVGVALDVRAATGVAVGLKVGVGTGPRVEALMSLGIATDVGTGVEIGVGDICPPLQPAIARVSAVRKTEYATLRKSIAIVHFLMIDSLPSWLQRHTLGVRRMARPSQISCRSLELAWCLGLLNQLLVAGAVDYFCGFGVSIVRGVCKLELPRDVRPQSVQRV